ncbi:FAD-dependent monooxygenase [Streptomyces mirabilis]|nr:FAD-dependent monooxygenase [Streptomyces mirabilis]
MNIDVDQDVDVTVVGAGPVGLVLAAELALSGATVQVLERLAEPSEAMKAGRSTCRRPRRLDRRGLLPAAESVQREMLERVGSFAPMADDQRPGGGRRAHASRFTGHFAGWSSTPASWTGPMPTSPRTPRSTGEDGAAA